jgi:biotin transport system substrate-specific component
MGGVGRLVGPTGGYLIGFLPAVYLIGIISEKGEQRLIFDVIAMVVGSVVIYAVGVSWLKILTGMTLAKTLAVGMVPFIPGDVIKIAVAVPITKTLRPILKVSGSGGQV